MTYGSLLSAVLLSMGGNAVVLIVVAFLAKSLVNHLLKKDVTQFKEQLQHHSALELERVRTSAQLASSTEIEKLKGALTLAASEHSIMLSRLQDKRAEIIGSMYQLIAVAIRETRSFVSPMQWSYEPPQIEKAGTARNALLAADNYFDENQIWLTPACAASVNELIVACRAIYNMLAVWVQYDERSLATQASDQKIKAAQAAWDAMDKDKVPPARAALEAEMRALLVPARTSA